MPSLTYLLIATVVLASQSDSQNCPRYIDFSLVLDASQSTCISDPAWTQYATTCVNWKAMTDFSHNLVDTMDIGLDQTLVALEIFATKGNRRFNLTRYTTKSSVETQIDQVPYSAGYTNMSGALDTLMALIFTPTFGDRPSVPDVALIITTGGATDPASVPDAIDRVHAAGVETYVIGVGNVSTGITDTYMQLLASNPKQINETYFIIPDFPSLASILTLVQQRICNDAAGQSCV